MAFSLGLLMYIGFALIAIVAINRAVGQDN